LADAEGTILAKLEWYRLAVCRRERVFSEEGALGGHFEVKIRATDAILPSHSTINEVGKLLSDRLLGNEVSDRQWDDILGVLKVRVDDIDRDYLRHWAARLRLSDLLARAFDDAGAA